eukprot:INCI16155.2.p1 GENE.INCI16155.2~~INCI16155.2.p1  ORF type:complete len:966 (-),score=127.17 INCI16155.2:181-3078(-)
MLPISKKNQVSEKDANFDVQICCLIECLRCKVLLIYFEMCPFIQLIQRLPKDIVSLSADSPGIFYVLVLLTHHSSLSSSPVSEPVSSSSLTSRDLTSATRLFRRDSTGDIAATIGSASSDAKRSSSSLKLLITFASVGGWLVLFFGDHSSLSVSVSLSSSSSSSSFAASSSAPSSSSSPAREPVVQWERGRTESEKAQLAVAKAEKRKFNRRAALTHRAFLVCGCAALRLHHAVARDRTLQARLLSCLPRPLLAQYGTDPTDPSTFRLRAECTVGWVRTATSWLHGFFKEVPLGMDGQPPLDAARVDEILRRRCASAIEKSVLLVALCTALEYPSRLVLAMRPPHHRHRADGRRATPQPTQRSGKAKGNPKRRNELRAKIDRMLIVWVEVLCRAPGAAQSRWIPADPTTNTISTSSDGPHFAKIVLDNALTTRRHARTAPSASPIKKKVGRSNTTVSISRPAANTRKSKSRVGGSKEHPLLAYVVAAESNTCYHCLLTDVTRRYSSSFSTLKKRRLPVKAGLSDFPASSSSESRTHVGVSCDQCGMNPIIGKRFKRQGENFDLCERDFAKLASKSDEACHFVEVSPQRVGTGGNRAPSWWSAVLDNLSQPRSANSYSARDRERFDAEQATEWAALQERVENEAAPTSLDGFRRHANFVLKRFVRHDEVLRHVLAVAPPTKLGENSGDATQTSVEASPVEPVGFHRGEPYFLRKHLHKVFSERAWFRKFARVVRKSDVGNPVKFVDRTVRKRAAPDNIHDSGLDSTRKSFGGPSPLPRRNMRGISRDEMQGLKADGSILPAHDKEISSSKDEADGNVEISEVPDGKRRVPLFGRWQTEPWDPGSVDSISGDVPTNGYGNVELWTPAHLPRGCIHIPYHGLHKIAEKLGVPCAQAVVDFEFNKGNMTPRYAGIVVGAQYRQLLEDAAREDQLIRAEVSYPLCAPRSSDCLFFGLCTTVNSCADVNSV